MEKIIDQIITQFQEKLQHITTTNRDELLKVNQGIKLCQATLSKLKKIITNHSFDDMVSEILFFKQIKILPMSYLLYYDQVHYCETRMPKIGYKIQKKYLEQKMEEINTFFSVNSIFVNYVRLQCSNLDECYFTRTFMDNATSTEANGIYHDPEFNTMHDILLAKVKANYMYMEYINKKLRELQSSTGDLPMIKKLEKPLEYLGNSIDWVEVIYALHEGKVFKGQPKITVIQRAVEHAFNVKIGNIHHRKQEIKNRKGERLTFLPFLLNVLITSLNKRDGFNSSK